MRQEAKHVLAKVQLSSYCPDGIRQIFFVHAEFQLSSFYPDGLLAFFKKNSRFFEENFKNF
jgi:hypothetical protein